MNRIESNRIWEISKQGSNQDSNLGNSDSIQFERFESQEKFESQKFQNKIRISEIRIKIELFHPIQMQALMSW